MTIPLAKTKYNIEIPTWMLERCDRIYKDRARHEFLKGNPIVNKTTHKMWVDNGLTWTHTKKGNYIF